MESDLNQFHADLTKEQYAQGFMSDTPTPRTDILASEYAGKRISSKECGSIYDHARQLERDLTEAREQLKVSSDEFYKYHGLWERATKQLETVTYQRDRMAEALNQCREDSVELLGRSRWWQNDIRLDYPKRYQETRDNVTRADEALQSLNQPNEHE